jgi:1,4-dihydroxy-2-naphthoate octaprenyltransferase
MGFDSKSRQVHILKNISIAGALLIAKKFFRNERDNESLCDSLFRISFSTRPWSLPASLVPCIVVLSSLPGPIVDIPEFVAFIFGVISLQAASNLFNSFADFRNAVDTVESAGDRTIVDGYLLSDSCFYLGSLFFISWVYSFWFCFHSSDSLIVFGLCLVGGAISLFYSLGRFPLKYYGIGDFCVFIAFGPLLSSTAAAAAGHQDFDSARNACAISSAVALMVVAILHANNLRDLESDQAAGANTVAVWIGLKKSLIYYDLLMLGPFVLLAVLAKIFENPGICFGVIALPRAWGLTRRVKIKIERDIDELTAQTMVMFGIAQSIGFYLWSRYF